MLEKLLAIARPASYPRGTRLIRQGEPARGAFVIRSGRVEAQVALPGGGTLAVAELGEGEMFGEMALLERGVCTASVFARDPVQAWFIERDDFRAMVATREPGALELQRNITQVLAAKLRALNAKVRSHRAAEETPAKESAPMKPAAPAFDWRRFLPILAFFEGFEAHEIDELVARSRAIELARASLVFSSGEPARACYIVVRGAVEIFSPGAGSERRVALAGPGEMFGHMALIEDRPHGAAARVREHACLLELAAKDFLELYRGDSGTSVSVQHAIHKSLLRALARTNTRLSRLISHAHLMARKDATELERALHGQIVQAG